MKKVKTKFRLNVLISYPKNINPVNFRGPILSILKNFAWLYKLDYKIDEQSQVFDNIEASVYQNPDLIYFRSADDTPLDRKQFQKIISDVFAYNPFLGGVEVFYQMQKVLKQYPFPVEYIRPLNYPYLEYHKDGQSEIKLPVSELKELFPDLDI